MATIGSLVLSLVTDLAEFVPGLQQGGKEVDKFVRKVETSNDSLSGMARHMRDARQASQAIGLIAEDFEAAGGGAAAFANQLKSVGVNAEMAVAHVAGLKDAAESFGAFLMSPKGLAVSAIVGAGVAIRQALYAEAEGFDAQTRKDAAAPDNAFNAYGRWLEQQQAMIDQMEASAAREAKAMEPGLNILRGLYNQANPVSRTEEAARRMREAMQGLVDSGQISKQTFENLVKEAEKLGAKLDDVAAAQKRVDEERRKRQHDAGLADSFVGQFDPLATFDAKMRDISAALLNGGAAGMTSQVALQAIVAAAAGLPQLGESGSPGAALFGTQEAFTRERGQATNILDVLKKALGVQEKQLTQEEIIAKAVGAAKELKIFKIQN